MGKYNTTPVYLDNLCYHPTPIPLITLITILIPLIHPQSTDNSDYSDYSDTSNSSFNFHHLTLAIVFSIKTLNFTNGIDIAI